MKSEEEVEQLFVSWVETVQRGGFIETVHPAMTVKQFLRDRSVPRHVPNPFVFEGPPRLGLLPLPPAVVVGKNGSWWRRTLHRLFRRSR